MDRKKGGFWQKLKGSFCCKEREFYARHRLDVRREFLWCRRESEMGEYSVGSVGRKNNHRQFSQS